MHRLLKTALGISLAFVITGCTTMQPSKTALYQVESISEQKVTLAKQMAELWERARIIPNVTSSAPMISTHSEGLAEISRQNTENLRITGKLLEELENRVKQRMINNGRFDSISLSATPIVATNTHPLIVYKGQRKAWPIILQDGETRTLDVVWDEKGFLKIEQKELLLLQEGFEHISKKVEFPYYGGRVFPMENISFELSVAATVGFN